MARVLIIDDESTIHKTFQKALKHEGYELLFAEHGAQGLEILKQITPDLIFLDLKMPVMNGFAFLEKIRIGPADPYLVVVITGHGYDQEVEKSFASGVNFFLRKPLSMTEICGLTKRCIEIKQIEREIRAHRDHLEQLVAERTRQIEEQLHFQQTLLDSIPAPVFFKDPQLVYLGCNAAFEQMLRVKRKKIIGGREADFVNPMLARLHTRKDRQVLKKGRQSYECELAVGRRARRQVIFTKATFKDSAGELGGLIGTIFDLTERKAAEAALESRSAKIEEANTALRVVLDQVGSSKREVEKKVLRNIKDLVLPDLNLLQKRTTSAKSKEDITRLKQNLAKLTDTPAQRLSSIFLTMSPREIQICDLIRMGKSNKAISLLLNISKSAVEFHRNNLRDKLGLKHQKQNLRTYLMNLD